MTLIAGLLIAALILQQVLHNRRIADLERLHGLERRALADRIQHPEQRQLEMPEDYERAEPPADAAELAYVGQEVPDFVHVGNTHQNGSQES